MQQGLNHELAKKFQENNTGLGVSKALSFSHKLSRMGRADIDTVLRAMDTQETGHGKEWSDMASFTPDVIAAVVRERKVTSLFERRDIPRSPYIWPVQGSRPKAYYTNENTESTGQTAVKSSKFGTARTQFDAKYLNVNIWTSQEFEDDSIVTVGPQVQENCLFGLVDGEEDGIINGDDSATHMDYDIEQNADNLDPQKVVKGLRARVNAGAKVDLDGGDILDAVVTATAKMGPYGARKSDLAIITGVSGEAALLKSGKLQTVDKYGQYATLLTGEVGRIFNIPVIVSEYVRENVSSTGVNTNGGTNTFTTMLIAHRRAFVTAVQKGVAFEPGREPLFNQDYLIARERIDFGSWYPSTDNTVALIHNIPSIA